MTPWTTPTNQSSYPKSDVNVMMGALMRSGLRVVRSCDPAESVAPLLGRRSAARILPQVEEFVVPGALTPCMHGTDVYETRTPNSKFARKNLNPPPPSDITMVSQRHQPRRAHVSREN